MLKRSVILTGYLLFTTANLISANAQAAENALTETALTNGPLITYSAERSIDTTTEKQDLSELVKRTELININNASQRELVSLAGIGKVKAAQIIAWREQHGAFQSIDELTKVSGIGKKTIANIARYITTQ